MKISEFIEKHVFRRRLEKQPVLVVYDPQRLYRDVCLSLADDHLRVVDATESSIEARETAAECLLQLGKHNTKLHGMLIYVPTARTVDDESRQADPFAGFAACGAAFPDGDGDSYRSLCLQAKPDHATDIRRIFDQNAQPEFSVIDAIGTAAGWPVLQATLKGESARELILKLLHTSEEIVNRLNEDGNDQWVDEAKQLLLQSLGLKLKTRGRKYASISDELWRFVLYSEFVFDLPTELPEELAEVPRADDAARPLIEDLCDYLRNYSDAQSAYITKAEAIESDLSLKSICSEIANLGERDTFPFEERSFFAQATRALVNGDLELVRQIEGRHSDSVWIGKGENNVQWQLLRTAAALIEACDDASRQLSDNGSSLTSLVSWYVASLKDVDRIHREFHELCNDFPILDASLKPAVERADRDYLKLMTAVHGGFLRRVQESGWPASGFAANAETFSKYVANRVQESGRRVAYVLIDALRYELGVALQRELSDDALVNLHPACGQLPSVTPVGMASLLPAASDDLELRKHGNRIVPYLAETPLKSGSARMKLLKTQFGERFQDMTLGDFLNKKHPVEDSTELLVIRTNRMDSQLEDDNDDELDLSVVRRTMKRIRAAVYQLKELGFDDAVIATDHGFFLNTDTDPGNVAAQPSGDWISLHNRCLLGDGGTDAHSFIASTEHLGIRGDFSKFVIPKGMVGYQRGMTYFHGGLSLQEAVVPVLELNLKVATEEHDGEVNVRLSYRDGMKKITSRMPVIELAVHGTQLFHSEVEILIEARDNDQNVVGEARTGANTSATGTLTVSPGSEVKVPLRMDHQFEGSFTVLALEPTTLTIFDKLKLKTDYVV